MSTKGGEKAMVTSSLVVVLNDFTVINPTDFPLTVPVENNTPFNLKGCRITSKSNCFP